MYKSEPFKKCPLCNGSFKGLGDHIQRTHSIEFAQMLYFFAKSRTINILGKEVDKLFSSE